MGRARRARPTASPRKDFVRAKDPVTGRGASRSVHEQGSFVFRLAGRERQQSASYYTPEVLTRFVVSHALEELLDQDGSTTTAAEILDLTICEPALGSGAFAIEAVRQLADAVPAAPPGGARCRRSTRTSTRDELQKVKAYLALHQTYGVDLNATAVELAEISLWLDTMVAGPRAPLVRPAPAAWQLADRRAQGGLYPSAGRRQVVAGGGAGAGRRRAG